MAYITQENKREKAPKIKSILKKYGLQGRLGIKHHSTLVLNIRKGELDFFKDFNRNNPSEFPVEKHMTVNEYHIDKTYSGVYRDCLNEITSVMNEGNHDYSDSMTDYFNVGWYIDINIGTWDRDYILL